MNVRIDSAHEGPLRKLAESSGSTVEEVVDKLIRVGINCAPTNGDLATVEASAWKPKLLRFLDEMKSLPVASPGDNFSGADHDDVLYPREP